MKIKLYKNLKNERNIMNKLIILITIISTISLLMALYNILTFNEKFNTFNGSLSDLSKKIDSTNDLIKIQTDVYFSDVVDSVKQSIVKVISYPFTGNDSSKAAFLFVDSSGKQWNAGTGFSFDSNGNIFTAYHVIENSQRIAIILPNDTILPIKNSMSYPFLDLTILYVNSSVPPVKIYNGPTVKIGSKIAFIGFPLGPDFSPITHEGIVSSIIPFTYQNMTIPVYTINSNVNFGNSGGPLFLRENGNVIGIINAKFTTQEGIGISTQINQCLIIFLTTGKSC